MLHKKRYSNRFIIPCIIALVCGMFFVFMLYDSPTKPTYQITKTYRDDYRVVFKEGIIETFKQSYDTDREYMFCLLGEQKGDTIIVDGLYEEKLLEHNKYIIRYANDPPCQINRSIGSIHSHPPSEECRPSDNDLFAFGEMKDPEPIIAIIHCQHDELLIMKLPDKHNGLDYRSLRWSVE
ncbi:hypothetical protein JXA85_01480 [Candidatus Woesearchaeota archaeon]|nr:hypothetical protein [Candidatus Woesearchaeota archaeon]